MRVTTVDHPLAAVQLTELRDHRTDPPAFRRALAALTRSLVHAATVDLATSETSIVTPMGPATGTQLLEVPLLVPILRAGLGMLDAALEVLPTASTGYLGLKRDESTLQPSVYMNTIPTKLDQTPVIVLDPMLATGGSAAYAAEQVRQATTGPITLVCTLAAPEGVDALRTAGTVDHVVTAAIDSHLNDVGFIVPGLGDAGDRQFGVD